MSKRIILIAEEGDVIGEKKLIQLCLKGEMVNKQWKMPDGTLWDVVVTGVGAINVLRTLRAYSQDTIAINIGYAGSSNFQIGSIVAVTQAKLNHPNCSYPEPEIELESLEQSLCNTPSLLHAPCYSGADFVLQSNYKDCVFDMELAYIAALGFKELYSFKVVSDNLSLHTYREVAAGVQTT
ncbi:MAG: hypothetical protein J6J29_07070 [Paludibacteraceae bacterium]|nr:hypothetical protein [Paludibacteraceae bacterium]